MLGQIDLADETVGRLDARDTRKLESVFLAPVSSALAGDDALSALYGNTLISRDNGIGSHFWYKPDRTFTGTVPAFYLALKGTWSENADGTVCRIFDPPLPTMKNPDSGPVPVYKLGETETDAHGDSEKLIAWIH